MVFLEPKDRVHYRWLGSAFAKLKLGPALSGLQGWMTAALATLGVGIALLLWLGQTSTPPDQATIGAMLGFLSRDMAIVVLAGMLSRRKSGDFAAIAILFALYVLLPAIVKGMNYESGLVFFFPRTSDPLWLSPLLAWSEAVFATVLASAAWRCQKRKNRRRAPDHPPANTAPLRRGRRDRATSATPRRAAISNPDRATAPAWRRRAPPPTTRHAPRDRHAEFHFAALARAE